MGQHRVSGPFRCLGLALATTAACATHFFTPSPQRHLAPGESPSPGPESRSPASMASAESRSPDLLRGRRLGNAGVNGGGKSSAVATVVDPPKPADIRRARQWVRRGLAAYRRGDYGPAEDLLKRAMSVYPFLPQANLALGKIFLIRGSAARDAALINNARLMFEMARAIDPSLRETEVLLELFPEGESSPGGAMTREIADGSTPR